MRPSPVPRTTPPLHRSREAVALVAAGGAVGALLRLAVARTLTVRPGGLPVATLAVNLLGSFVLGLLLEALLRLGPDDGVRRRLRLAVGTGLVGAFTTYSTLAVEVELLAREGRAGTALVYGLGSALLGLAAAAAGVGTALRVRRRPG